jgi:hypothetical protein
MNRLAQVYWTAKGVNWRNVPRRLLQAWRLRSGSLRRRLDPARFSDEQFAAECEALPPGQPTLWTQRAKRFPRLPAAADLAAVADDATWRERVIAVAEKALSGDYPMFSHWCGRLGWPPDFNLDPVHVLRWPVGEHWLRTARSVGPDRDIKLVWEASRFTLAYYFARAYARAGDERFAEAFWRMFEAWIEQNPPMLSVAWGCGQEMTFRLMAMLTAAVATLPSPAATPRRLHALSRLAWQTGRSIELNINQARMQGNNHAVSEAVGLWTIGVLFPEFARSNRWKDKGRRALAAEIAWQVYPDGSYVQHSLNYHRVMMDDLLWATALARASGTPLPPVVLDRLERAARWLAEMIDPVSGRVPNYGPNDGANVLPLSCQGYLDHRPTAQAAWQMLYGRRLFDPGPWDEKALWLTGRQSLGAAVERPKRSATFAAPDGGYYILRGGQSWAMVRCHSYRHRPNHADMLHVDLWYKGINILRDAGSYSYCCEEPWNHYFHSTAAHNTVEIDGRDQMTKGPRFLWFRWTKSRMLRFARTADGAVFEGEHHGYRSVGVTHRRTVSVNGNAWEIADCLNGQGTHTANLLYRLCQADWRLVGDVLEGEIGGKKIELRFSAPHGFSITLLDATNDCHDGTESCFYGSKSHSPAVVLRGRFHLPVKVACQLADAADSPTAVSTAETPAYPRTWGIPGLPLAPTDLPPLNACERLLHSRLPAYVRPEWVLLNVYASNPSTVSAVAAKPGLSVRAVRHPKEMQPEEKWFMETRTSPTLWRFWSHRLARQECMLFLTSLDGELVHYSFVLLRGPSFHQWTAVFHPGAAIVGPAYTVPESRGLRVFGQTVEQVVGQLAGAGVQWAYIFARHDNIPSLGGIRKMSDWRAIGQFLFRRCAFGRRKLVAATVVAPLAVKSYEKR